MLTSVIDQQDQAKPFLRRSNLEYFDKPLEKFRTDRTNLTEKNVDFRRSSFNCSETQFIEGASIKSVITK